MKTLALYLCEWHCNTADHERDRSVPCTDTSVCTCGAAERNRLILDTRKAASDVSYHNAAEGDAWHREREAARRAEDRFDELTRLCAEAGIDWKQGESYLL